MLSGSRSEIQGSPFAVARLVTVHRSCFIKRVIDWQDWIVPPFYCFTTVHATLRIEAVGFIGVTQRNATHGLQ